MSDLLKHIVEIELALKAPAKSEPEVAKRRKRVRDAVRAIASLVPDPDPHTNLAETLRGAVASCPSQEKRTLATLYLRLLGSSDLLTETDIQKCRRQIVSLVEDKCPDLTKGLFKPDELNHVKIEAMARVHQSACRCIEPLAESFVSLQDLANRRQKIMRSMSKRKYKGYLNPFGYDSVLGLVDSLLGQVGSIVQAQGHDLQSTLQQLVDDIPIQLENCRKTQTFVFTEYAMPFLERLQQSARTMKDGLPGTFACRISVPDAVWEVEKRYPLHRVGAEIEVAVPLSVVGPGVAQNVTTSCVADNCTVKSAEMILGNVAPGPLVLPLVIELTEPASELQPMIEVKWSVVGDPEERQEVLTTLIRDSERTSIGNSLSNRPPTTLRSPTTKTSTVAAMC